jgi:uncharacterized membrane protein
MLMQSMLIVVTPVSADTEGRGGSSDDFFVSKITVANASAVNNWIQPSGTILQYIEVGDTVDIEVEVKRGGGALSGTDATVTVEIVHPIGFVVNSTSWPTVSMLGGQTHTDSFSWTATVAHSILNISTNELQGGLIIRATVTNNLDDRNENDVMEQTLPVAVAQDEMEGEADGVPSVGQSLMFPGRYPANGGSATGKGIWQSDNSDGAKGTIHMKHANDGSDYPSGAHDRLIYGHRGTSNWQCNQGAYLDGDLSNNAYGSMAVCKNQFVSAAYVSAQVHVQTWGMMGAGDYVALEFWRNNGGPGNELTHNFSEDLPGTSSGQWSNISWDPTELLGGHSYSYGILFHSDTSGAASGMHVDDFVLFGVEKVPEFTLDIDCDSPDSGYTTPPNTVLPMHCYITNNGYQPAAVLIQSDVSNLTWMSPIPMIRIDSEHPSQHGTSISLPPIPGGNVSEMWINLSVPAGADVQQQVWQVWWTDNGGTELGELGRISSDVAVTEQFGVYLSSSAPLIADSLGPGETGEIPFRLQNSGNKEAGFTITSNFPLDDGWTAFVTDLNSSIVQMPLPLGKGEQIDLFLNVTAPSNSAPGEVPFTLRAVCPTCGQSLFGTDVISKKIEVPTLINLGMIAESYDLIGSANGQNIVVYVDLFNLGNADETYTLERVESNWNLLSYLSSDETTVLDAWDGETSIALNLPMPIGLEPGLYTVTIKATSVSDPSVTEQITINVEITDTAAVAVSDEVADQSFIPGDPSQSMRFEVTNAGNQPDKFKMSLDPPEGMNAHFEQILDNQTPMLEPGASYNVTVTFDFDDDIDGQLILKVIATSVNEPDVSSFGKCTYFVGSQNWIRIIADETTVITEPGEYVVVVKIRNQYTDSQGVSMSLDQQGSNRWYSASIDTSDRDFTLALEQTRDVTIRFEVTESSLMNLEEDFIDTHVRIWAISNTVEDAASLDLQVTLTKMKSSDQINDAADGQSFDWIGIATWIVGSSLIIALVAVLIGVLNGGEEEEEEQDWAEEGYEDNISATYGNVAAAPTIEPPKEIPVLAPPTPVPEPVAQTGPAIPAGGLPEGWTTDQWQHYGQQWLDSQN